MQDIPSGPEITALGHITMSRNCPPPSSLLDHPLCLMQSHDPSASGGWLGPVSLDSELLKEEPPSSTTQNEYHSPALARVMPRNGKYQPFPAQGPMARSCFRFPLPHFDCERIFHGIPLCFTRSNTNSCCRCGKNKQITAWALWQLEILSLLRM